MLLRTALAGEKAKLRAPRFLFWPPMKLDALIYAVASAFTLVFALTTTQPAQWQWGYLAFGPYAGAALFSLVASHFSISNRLLVRVFLLALVIMGAVLLPLVLESRWRHVDHDTLDAQPEVSVIERAANSLKDGKSPYQTYVKHGHVYDATPGIPTYESFFPYFPLMGIFGLPSVETHDSLGLTDARIVMSTVTILLCWLALALMRAPPRKKMRIAQFLIALPTGALFLATGGDDMPIIALMLLAVVFMQRHQAWSAGVTLGIAAAMKLTAWPFALGAMLVVRGSNGRRAWFRVAVAVAVIVGATAIPYVIKAPWAFISNVFAFPLGLSGVSSPAASALPGHILTTWWPPLRHVILPVVFVVGGYYTARYIRRSWPITLPSLLRYLSVSSVVVICAATATRVGYIIYPINFLLWSWALTPDKTEGADDEIVISAFAYTPSESW